MADTPRPARVTRESVEHIDLEELRSTLRQVVDSTPPEVLKQYLRLVKDLDRFDRLTEEQTLEVLALVHMILAVAYKLTADESD